VARMVQAGSPPAVCARCGAPYERLTRRSIATYPAADDPTMDTLPVEGVGADYPALRARDYADPGKAALHRQRWNDGYWKKKPKNLVVAEQVEEFGRHNYRDGGQVHDEWKESSVAMLGWRPGCACFDHPFAPPRAAADRYVAHPVCAASGEPHTKPAIVLDVCAGSGTTVQVAGLLGRRCVGLDVSFAYLRDQGLRRVAEPAKVYRRPALPALAWAEPLPGNEVLFADVADVLPRLPRAEASLVFLDPPFNLGKDYGGPGDRLREAAYWELLRFWLDLAAPLIKKNGSLVLHHVPLWAFRAADYLSRRGMTFRRWVAWQAGPGPMYQANRHGMKPEHYVFLWFSWGTEREVNQVFTPHPRCARCGDYADDWGGKEKHRDPAGGRMGDVWTRLPRLRSAQKARGANELPLEAALRWVLALTDPGDYVLDAFAGSGTVGAACELGGRRWGGVEVVEDNAPAIRLKALTARGAAEVIAPGALAALPAETRMALAKALQYLWGDGRLRRAGDSALLARGREAAQQALALISDTEHV
jgi:site-specific DNA-methyltransferase (adenine-specific)